MAAREQPPRAPRTGLRRTLQVVLGLSALVLVGWLLTSLLPHARRTPEQNDATRVAELVALSLRVDTAGGYLRFRDEHVCRELRDVGTAPTTPGGRTSSGPGTRAPTTFGPGLPDPTALREHPDLPLYPPGTAPVLDGPVTVAVSGDIASATYAVRLGADMPRQERQDRYVRENDDWKAC